MSRRVTRRKFMAGTAAGAVAATLKFPAPAIAQAAPFKLGLLTIKTGPLAQGGIQMEQGVITYLKEKDYTFAGRKVDFISADTGGSPAGAKTKARSWSSAIRSTRSSGRSQPSSCWRSPITLRKRKHRCSAWLLPRI